MTVDEWNNKYPLFNRLCNTSRYNKGTLRIITPEISKKLKKSHTLDGYIEKYGEEVEKEKYNKWLEYNKVKNTLPFYLEKYSKKEGYNKWFNKNKKKFRKQ